MIEDRRRRAIGAKIASQLRPIRTLEEVAQMTGVSYQRVQQIEQDALYKLAIKCREVFKECPV